MLNKKIGTLLIAIPTLLLSSCGNDNIIDTPNGQIDISNKDYKDYKEFSLTSLDEFYFKDGKYGVHLYYETCPSCKKVKPYLFRHLEFLKADLKKSNIYLFDMKSKNDESGEGLANRQKFKTFTSDKNRDDLIDEMVNKKVDKLEDTYFFGVPSLYIIEDHKLVDFYYGSDEITDYYRYLD